MIKRLGAAYFKNWGRPMAEFNILMATRPHLANYAKAGPHPAKDKLWESLTTY